MTERGTKAIMPRVKDKMMSKEKMTFTEIDELIEDWLKARNTNTEAALKMAEQSGRLHSILLFLLDRRMTVEEVITKFKEEINNGLQE